MEEVTFNVGKKLAERIRNHPEMQNHNLTEGICGMLLNYLMELEACPEDYQISEGFGNPICSEDFIGVDDDWDEFVKE
jgi:hypothetical protein